MTGIKIADLNILIKWIFWPVFIKIENNSKANTNRYAEIGSPYLAPLSGRKYVVVCHQLITRHSWFLNKILIHSYKILTKTVFFKNRNEKFMI